MQCRLVSEFLYQSFMAMIYNISVFRFRSSVQKHFLNHSGFDSYDKQFKKLHFVAFRYNSSEFSRMLLLWSSY